MKYNLYTLYDKEAKLGGSPFMARNDDVAIRMVHFLDLKDVPSSKLDLICLGCFDNETCRISHVSIKKVGGNDEGTN